MSEERKHWWGREPWVVQDPGFKREWVSVEPLQYYVHQAKDCLWTVIDRWWDVNVCGYHKTREAAIRAFYKLKERPIPTGTKLGRFKDSQFGG